MKKIFAALSLALLLLSPAAFAQDLCSDPVATAAGPVIGRDDPDGPNCVWRGIPFAAPPVGELRWKTPQPVKPWTEPLEAFEFSPACMQVPARKKQSEDCLYLNVWRPKKSGVFPVMVWIHGGGYLMGSGSGGLGGDGSYNGAQLAAVGEVVVVTINYRLHLFGFLADPALRAEDPHRSTGNYGSLDQVAAIRWVHDNIAAFGGDPNNVTIFGQSAGGWSVCTMLATPLNQGMLAHAIIESGGCGKTESMEAGYERSAIAIKNAGCNPGDLPCMRALSADDLLKHGLVNLYRRGMEWGPHHDGYLLDARPLDMIRAGNFNRVPLIAGFTRNEVDAVLIARPQLWNALPFQYRSVVRRNLGLSEEVADRLVDLYALKDFDNKPRKAFGKMFTDAGLACPTYLGLDALARQGQPAYFYRFDYDDVKFGGFLGAFHSAEVPFVFDTLQGGERKSIYARGAREAALELVRVIQGYWINFSRTGNPNGEGLREWPAYTAEGQEMMTLDTTLSVTPAGMSDRCAFWDDYTAKHPGFFETGLGRNQEK